MKRLLLITLLFLIYLVGYAEYLKFVPVVVTQPDKTQIHCFATGDEFYNILHDKDGYTIVQSELDGYYYYAIKQNNKLLPSVYRVGSIDPKAIGIQPWLRAYVPVVTKSSESEDQPMRVRGANIQKATQFSTGLLNNIVIYISLKGDAPFVKDRKYYSSILEGTTVASLKGYYEEVSYGKFSVKSYQFPVCDSTTNLCYQDDSLSRAAYLPYNAVTNPDGYTTAAIGSERQHTLIYKAVNYIKSQVSPNIVLDADGDGLVDNITVVIKSGTPATAWGTILWPQQGKLTLKTAYINGIKVGNFILVSETYNAVTVCHEMFHVLGAPDFYRYSDTSIDPCAGWTGDTQHMLAYAKYKYANQNWISVIPEITKSGDYSLKPLASASNNCYKIKSPYSTSEFFMLEFRKKSGLYESRVPGTGLLITRINTLTTGSAGGPPDEIYVFRPQGSLTSNGDLTKAAFTDVEGRTSFNSTTNPRAFLSDGSDGGVSISNIVVKADSVCFHVDIAESAIDKSLWQLTADSYEATTIDGTISNAMDDKATTFWFSKSPTNTTANPYPHWIQMNFGKTMSIKGFKYLSRPNDARGWIKDYEFYTSMDAVNWTKVCNGTFNYNLSARKVLNGVITFPERRCQYAKLVGLTEYGGRLQAAVAELNFIFTNTLIPKKKWTLLNASSYETAKPPTLAFDSLATTCWTSKTTAPAAVSPHTIAVDMNDTLSIESMAYLPRQDGVADGIIADYEFYTSMDAVNWKLMSKGKWASNAGEKKINFDKTVSRYFKLVSISDTNLSGVASVAEVSVFGSKTIDVTPPAKPTNFKIASTDASALNLVWDMPVMEDANSVFYKISNAQGSLGQTTVNQFAAAVDVSQKQTFGLVAIDGSGNQSELATLSYVGATALESANELALKIYASNNHVYVSNTTTACTVKIMGMLGEEVAKSDIESVTHDIDMKGRRGVYIVGLYSGHQLIFRKKIILD